MSKALVVLSGGQDSTTCLFWAVERFGADNVFAITFDYNQRHRRELEAARAVRRLAGVPEVRHYYTALGPVLLGKSPLTDHKAQLEQYDNHDQMEKVIGDRVELTFVPMRNALFLTLAANLAVVKDIENIVTGVCQADNANYPDCRESFVAAMGYMANQALGRSVGMPGAIRYLTPLMDMTKDMSITLALSLPGCYRALAYSHTAYDGQYPPVGKDHATVLRAHGFEMAGVPDPLVLRAVKEDLMDFPHTPNYSTKAISNVLEKLTPDEIPTGWVR